MSVTIFVHLNESEDNNFDIRKFKKDIEIKYPGTNLEVSNSALSYDLCWENYSEQYQFELRMDRKRCTFAIGYFNSDNRIWDYASFILWTSMYFPKEKEVVLVDENYEDQMPLSSDISIEDIEKWLEKVLTAPKPECAEGFICGQWGGACQEIYRINFNFIEVLK